VTESFEEPNVRGFAGNSLIKNCSYSEGKEEL
jgi:hypothetical protein